MNIDRLFRSRMGNAMCIGTLAFVSLFILSCNNKGSTKEKTDRNTDTASVATTSGTQNEIHVGGHRFVLTDVPVSRFLFMGKDTAEYYFNISGDTLCISTAYILPGGATDVYEIFWLHPNDIDTAASVLNRVTLDEGNANEFNIMALKGKSFRYVSYQKDSTVTQNPAPEARLIVMSDSTADRLARLMRISR